MSFPGAVTAARVLLFTYLSNPTKFDADAFIRACSKFGLDCPVAQVSRRLSLYGNTNEIKIEVQ